MQKITSKDFFWVFLRSNFHAGSFNFERMHALGFCFQMVPIIKRLYEGEERKKAMKRHLEFFNTHPYAGAPIVGITASMEEQRANGQDISDSVINGIKVGMMGPLAGVGDPIFWGTLRPLTAALGASLALSGSIGGPLLFFLFYNVVRIVVRWYGLKYGYAKGTDIVKDLAGNKLQKLTEGAAILGLFVMGALVNKWTSVNIPVVVSQVTMQNGKIATTTIQTILDQLMPGLIPLLLTFVCMHLLKKNVNAIWIIFGLFAIGIVGFWLGILK